MLVGFTDAAIIAPGFFTSPAVRLAAAIGAVTAIVAATIGVFTVIRGQAFAGEALGDLGATGGSSAYLLGISPVFGFLSSSLLAAGLIEAIGTRRARGRDLATGVVLGTGFGLAALFLYLAATDAGTSGATVTILFGSVFALQDGELPVVLALGALTLAAVAALYRPLLLASISPELAAARRLPVRWIGVGYLAALAAATTLSALTIGAILSTALLVGPAATALRLTRSPARAIVTAAALGVGSVWLGLLLAYDSYDWPPLHHGWPASFFVVALVLVCYLASGPLAGRRSGRG
jgi:zinc/manganese transport system permease protein